jgi:hypothetical protein
MTWLLGKLAELKEGFTYEVMDVLIVVAIVGVFLNMFGNKDLAKKVTGGAILAGLIYKVVVK